MYDGHMYGFFGGFMWLFWLVVIIAIIGVIKATGGRPAGTRKSALELLDERYARGEIERDEYEQKHKDLKGDG
jgi:putative membrane protein